jgi:murein DD-endopeptidase MepM/ murein hydrolase activator NlpD
MKTTRRTAALLALSTLATGVCLTLARPATAQDLPPEPEFDLVTHHDDGDQVPIEADACPTTPEGLPALVAGCAATELVRDPRPLLGAALDTAATLRDSIAGQRVFGEVEADLNAGLRAFAAADDAVRAGTACEASLLVREGIDHLTHGAEASRQAEIWLRAGVVRPAVRGATEADAEIEASMADLRADALAALAGRTAALALGGLERLCDATVQSVRVRGAVEAIDPLTGVVTIAGLPGLVLGDRLPEGAGVPGVELDYDIELLEDGTGVVVSAEGFLAVPLGGLTLPCAELAVEPVEPHAPFTNTPPTLHDPSAYYWYPQDEEGVGAIMFEKGMRLAYRGFECAGPDSGGGRGIDAGVVRHFHRLTISYVSKYDGETKERVLAAAMVAGDTPVSLPDDAVSGSMVTLTRRNLRQVCTAALKCETDSKLAGIDSYLLAERGGLCQAQYDTQAFRALQPGDFDVARVTGHATPPLVDPQGDGVFTALGRRIVNGLPAATPSKVHVGDAFAVANPDIVDPDGFLQQEIYGLDHAAGLVWPHLRSKSGDWQYSCSLPRVAHDGLAECGDLGAMGYQLPFDAADLTWSVGQGNNGSFTHNGNQAFAFDLGAAAGTDILAARGGKVLAVREDQSGNSYADPNCTSCGANFVQVRHDDGSVGTYLHMPTNGVSVAVDQRVERGTVLGQVGNTGYSTGPHVHFQVTPSAFQAATMPIAFELRTAVKTAKGWKPGDVAECAVPVTGAKVFSTNTRL